MPWDPPVLTVRWPPYFQPSAEDDQKIVDTTIKALDGGIITPLMAVRKVQRVYGIEDPVAALAEIEKAKDERDAKAATDFHAAAADMNSEPDGDDSDEPQGAAGKRPTPGSPAAARGNQAGGNRGGRGPAAGPPKRAG